MTEPLQARIARVLSNIDNPRTGENLIDSEMVRDIATTTDGRVRLTMLVSSHDDPILARGVRNAVMAVEGVKDVQIDVVDAAELEKAKKTAARSLPVMNDRPAAARPAAPTPRAHENLGKIIAVSSGKGGVGKSTVAVNLAVALAAGGARVGLMDADVYGPNVPRMMGVNEPPAVVREQMIPLEAHGVKLMSLGFLIDRDQPAIWRGPIVNKIMTQFLRDVAWGELDWFIVDMPPGTGDAQLSLVQSTHLSGAIIVTTPQEVSVGDALRAVRMFQRVEIPVLGIVENMSWFECDGCGKRTALFGSGGGQRLADETSVPLLGQVPLYPAVMQGGDEGAPVVVSDPKSGAATAFTALAAKVAETARLPEPSRTLTAH